MRLSPGSRQSRLLALALVGLGAGVLYALVIGPLVSTYIEYDAQIDSKRVQLEQYRQIVARGQWAGAALKRMQAGGHQRRYYLPGGTLALASAKLQEHIKGLAQSTHGELISTQVLSERTGDGTPTVTLRVQMKGSLETLLNLFYAIETGMPVVILKNVVIASHGARHLTTTQAEGYRDELDIRFDIVGYMYEEQNNG